MGGCISVEVAQDPKKKPKGKSKLNGDASRPRSAERKKSSSLTEDGPKSSDKGSQKGSGPLSKSKKSSQKKSLEDLEGLREEKDPSGLRAAKRMKLKELQIATNNFDESLVLGEGSFGKVYKGYLDEVRSERGSSVVTKVDLAVKKLNPQSFQGYDEWLAEVLFLDKLRHPNLVRLVGYCAENGEALLAYELCPNGSLDQKFFSPEPEDLLSWEQRVKIAFDAAQGLAYLHEQNVIHRDLKFSNVLLGNDMVARLTDFGMAKEGPEGDKEHISTRVMGTMGYLDPAYMQTGRLTRKSDTYSYGVMLLELITGKKAIDEAMMKWARPLLAQRKPDILQLIDPRLGEQYSKAGATKMAILAKFCVDDDPVSRPEMQIIVDSLKKVLKDA